MAWTSQYRSVQRTSTVNNSNLINMFYLINFVSSIHWTSGHFEHLLYESPHHSIDYGQSLEGLSQEKFFLSAFFLSGRLLHPHTSQLWWIAFITGLLNPQLYLHMPLWICTAEQGMYCDGHSALFPYCSTVHFPTSFWASPTTSLQDKWVWE